MGKINQTTGNSYRSLLGSNMLMGGVQVLQTIVSLLKGKAVALLLGTVGLGVASLYNEAWTTVVQFASLGLNLALVRDIADCYDADGESGHDSTRFTQVKDTAINLIRIASVVGLLFCVAFAPWLSQITFGDADHTMQMRLLGVVVLLTVAAEGKRSILQGMHHLRLLSRATLVSSTIGLMASIPLYRFYGVGGIVWAMGVVALCNYLYYSLVLHRLDVSFTPVSFSMLRHQWPQAKRLMALGILLLMSSGLASVARYGLDVLIRSLGHLEAVGLYNAANSITVQYTAVIFAAMSFDFFPRLARAISSRQETSRLVNRQSVIVSLLSAPASCTVMALAPLVIELLLSRAFIEAVPLVRLMAWGVVFRTISYPLGYIAFAADNRRVFFLLEGLGGNLLFFILAAGGYLLYGLNGLGIAYVVENALMLGVYAVVNYRLYGTQPSSVTVRENLVAIVLTSVAFAAVSYIAYPMAMYVCSGVIAVCSVTYSSVRLYQIVGGIVHHD